MSLLVVGSIALDAIRLPGGKRHSDILGGSCSYFSLAAGFFTKVGVVGVVGGDFPKRHLALFDKHGIERSGLEIVPGGRTFRWAGTYAADMNARVTDDLQFGVLGDFDPKLSDAQRDASHLFLACAQPELQLRVFKQMRRKPLAACDTIEVYIRDSRAPLMEVFRRSRGVIVNDSEAALLFDDASAVRCAKKFLKLGPKFAVVKKGEHGGVLATREGIFPFPAYPLEKVADPTGAGDAFAGGFMAWLDRAGKEDADTLRAAVACGTAAASFACEGVGPAGLARRTASDLRARAKGFAELLRIPVKGL